MKVNSNIVLLGGIAGFGGTSGNEAAVVPFNGTGSHFIWNPETQTFVVGYSNNALAVSMSEGEHNVVLGGNNGIYSESQSDNVVIGHSNEIDPFNKATNFTMGNVVIGLGNTLGRETGEDPGNGARGNILIGSSLESLGTNPSFGEDNYIIGNSITTSGFSGIIIGQDTTLVAAADNAIAIGRNNAQTGANSISVGVAAETYGNYGLSIGHTAISGAGSVAIGKSSGIYSSDNAISIGNEAVSSANYGIAIGYSSSNASSDGIALGINSSTSGTTTIAIGKEASASVLDTIAIGKNSTANSNYAVSIGSSATASGLNSTTISGGATGDNSTAIGFGSSATAGYAIAIGDASATQNHAIAIGAGSTATVSNNVAIGNTANANGTNAISIGYNQTNQSANGIIIGSGADVIYANAITIGESNAVLKDYGIAIGKGTISRNYGEFARGVPVNLAGANYNRISRLELQSQCKVLTANPVDTYIPLALNGNLTGTTNISGLEFLEINNTTAMHIELVAVLKGVSGASAAHVAYWKRTFIVYYNDTNSSGKIIGGITNNAVLVPDYTSFGLSILPRIRVRVSKADGADATDFPYTDGSFTPARIKVLAAFTGSQFSADVDVVAQMNVLRIVNIA